MVRASSDKRRSCGGSEAPTSRSMWPARASPLVRLPWLCDLRTPARVAPNAATRRGFRTMQAPLSSRVVRSAAALAVMAIGLTIGFGVGLGRAAPAPGDTPTTTAPAATTTTAPAGDDHDRTGDHDDHRRRPRRPHRRPRRRRPDRRPRRPTGRPRRSSRRPRPRRSRRRRRRPRPPRPRLRRRLPLLRRPRASTSASSPATRTRSRSRGRPAVGPTARTPSRSTAGGPAPRRTTASTSPGSTAAPPTRRRWPIRRAARRTRSRSRRASACRRSLVRTLDGSGNNRRHADWGQAGRSTPGSRRRTTRTASARWPAARRPPGLEPDLQRPRAEHLLRERHLPVGLGLGPVHRPRHRPARRDAGRGGADPVRPRATRSSGSATTSVRSAFSRTPAAPGTGTGRRRPASRSTRSRASSMPPRCTATTDARLDWLDGRATAYDLLLPGGYLPRVTRAATRRPRRRWT